MEVLNVMNFVLSLLCLKKVVSSSQDCCASVSSSTTALIHALRTSDITTHLYSLGLCLQTGKKAVSVTCLFALELNLVSNYKSLVDSYVFPIIQQSNLYFSVRDIFYLQAYRSTS